MQTEFVAPEICVGFDGEEAPVEWGELDRLYADMEEARRTVYWDAERCAFVPGVAVMVRRERSKFIWYKRDPIPHYPRIKRYNWRDAVRAAKAAHARQLAAPQDFPLAGDRSGPRHLFNKSAAELAEIRYNDWLIQKAIDAETVDEMPLAA